MRTANPACQLSTSRRTLQKCVLVPRRARIWEDSCVTQLKDQGPARTCNESKEEEEESVDPSAAEVEYLSKSASVFGVGGVRLREENRRLLLHLHRERHLIFYYHVGP